MNPVNNAVLIIGLILIGVVAWQTYVIYGLKENMQVKESNKSCNFLEVASKEPASLSRGQNLNLFEEVQIMQQEMNNAFRRLSTNHADEPYFKLAFNNFFYAPSLDVASKESEYIVKTDIPGVKESDIKITVDGNVLNIRAEVSASNDENSSKYIKKERYISKFQRSVSLIDADYSKMKNSYEDGVLTITIPKKK